MVKRKSNKNGLDALDGLVGLGMGHYLYRHLIQLRPLSYSTFSHYGIGFNIIFTIIDIKF
jgi:hypothetical protein